MNGRASPFEPDVWVIEASGRLDATQVPALETALQEAMTRGRYRLLINLEQARCLSSSGLKALLIARREARAHGGDLAFCCIPPRIREVLETTGLIRIFAIYESEEEAAEASIGA
ncbi:MAG: STAS domain-containing protein [Anaerolineae bacterium]|jgi:anti-sigma B factor antagonist|nr:STAS domain-containing protein [Anaerolineae bacterium]MDH7475372.1 STAS domain-containing protein [Anaerolineae bacterium]